MPFLFEKPRFFRLGGKIDSGLFALYNLNHTDIISITHLGWNTYLDGRVVYRPFALFYFREKNKSLKIKILKVMPGYEWRKEAGKSRLREFAEE